MAKTPGKHDDLTEQAERLRATGQDPVSWLRTLALLEEKLLEWKRRKRITALGPNEAARAIREAHVWCAPSVILLVGALRTDIAKRKTDEDENPNPTRRAVNYGADTDERALRRIADAIADPGSDVSPARAEEIRLNYLAFEIRRFVQRRKAEGASAREALTEAARRYHFGSRVKAGPIVHGRPTDSRSTPGWQAVERFLLRRRPKKSTDVSPRAPNVGAEALLDAALSRDPAHKEPQRCRDRETPNAPAEPSSPPTFRRPSSGARPSLGPSTSPKGRSATSSSGGSGRGPFAPKGPGSSSTTSTSGSPTSSDVPRRRPTRRRSSSA